MRALQIGNFGPPHSTENELCDALERNGVEVARVQEDAPEQWTDTLKVLRDRAVDFVLWTHTPGFWGAPTLWPHWSDINYRMLDTAKRQGIPTIAYHLDRYWGLGWEREQIMGRPFFSCDYVFTADGGHDDEFHEAGINHHWLPPAINERYCYLAEPDPRYAFDIVFVGGWYNYGHTEWTHREGMIAKVREWYGERFRCLPKQGAPRITMDELNTIYASAKVVLGDSCLVPYPDGRPMVRYCSDRIPETMGRGGILVHPFVEGITGPVFLHESWPLGDWTALKQTLDCTIDLTTPEHAQAWRESNIERIKVEHTYTKRMAYVIEEVVVNQGANL